MHSPLPSDGSEHIYEVFALRYASITRRSSENFVGGDPHDREGRLDYFVWVARSTSRTFVVDTGFSHRSAERRGRTFLCSPVQALERLGIQSPEVRDVVITHLHYDHAGGFDDFPNARFHLQDAEMSFASGRFMASEFFSKGYDVDDVTDAVRLAYGGRIVFHDGDAELAPGLSVHLIGGHTQGMQCVRVRTAVGWVVLASDASHFYENMGRQRPFPIVCDVCAMSNGWQRLRQLADHDDLVVPGHDPLVMQRYPAPNPALDGWAVRLDVWPKAFPQQP